VGRVVRNRWVAGGGVERAAILSHATSPEGFEVARIRFLEGRELALPPHGHLLSVLSGLGEVVIDGEALHLDAGSHVYVPAGLQASLQGSAGWSLVLVSAPGPGRSRSAEPVLRHERFLAACAADAASRWILTPQYLSRRIFLHHDATLRSASGAPISWFHTTMFDVTGLPPNDEGAPVFRMSYAHRTEFNVCHDVPGTARVRMARHPYGDRRWAPWQPIDGEATYHLDEPRGGSAEEVGDDDAPLRNRHEVDITDGWVSLLCLFDPAPTGIETHRPGAFSSYGPLESVLGTAAYREYLDALKPLDEMVDALSLAQARGALEAMHDTDAWRVYEAGRRAQSERERQLIDRLRAEGDGREAILERWRVGSSTSLR